MTEQGMALDEQIVEVAESLQGEAQAPQTEQTVEVPSAEDWQKQVEERDVEIKGLKQALSKKGAEEQKLRNQVDSFTSMAEALSDVQDTMALHSDYFDELRGVTTEEPQAPRQGHYEQRQQQKADRAESEKNKPPPELSPEDADAFKDIYGIMSIKGWTKESPAIVKTLKMTSPIEALKSLKKSVQEEEEIRVNEGIQQKLKASGLTSAPPGGPSASSREFSAEQIGSMSYGQWVEQGRPNATRKN